VCIRSSFVTSSQKVSQPAPAKARIRPIAYALANDALFIDGSGAGVLSRNQQQKNGLRATNIGFVFVVGSSEQPIFAASIFCFGGQCEADKLANCFRAGRLVVLLFGPVFNDRPQGKRKPYHRYGILPSRRPATPLLGFNEGVGRCVQIEWETEPPCLNFTPTSHQWRSIF
jgi:hypothetical protein